jgi:predicted transcriptional regulator
MALYPRPPRGTVLNIRIDPALKAELQKLADRDRRPLSSWIKLLLEDAVKAEQPKRGR